MLLVFLKKLGLDIPVLLGQDNSITNPLSLGGFYDQLLLFTTGAGLGPKSRKGGGDFEGSMT